MSECFDGAEFGSCGVVCCDYYAVHCGSVGESGVRCEGTEVCSVGVCECGGVVYGSCFGVCGVCDACCADASDIYVVVCLICSEVLSECKGECMIVERLCRESEFLRQACEGERSVGICVDVDDGGCLYVTAVYVLGGPLSGEVVEGVLIDLQG